MFHIRRSVKVRRRDTFTILIYCSHHWRSEREPHHKEYIALYSNSKHLTRTDFTLCGGLWKMSSKIRSGSSNWGARNKRLIKFIFWWRVYDMVEAHHILGCSLSGCRQYDVRYQRISRVLATLGSQVVAQKSDRNWVDRIPAQRHEI